MSTMRRSRAANSMRPRSSAVTPCWPGGCPDPMNLLHPFFAQAAARGARTAIVAADGSSASYVDLMAQSARLAAVWQHKGIGAGDRVLLAMPLGIALYASLAALWRLGAVVVFP